MEAKRDASLDPERRKTAVSAGLPPSAVRVRATAFWVQDVGPVVKSHHPKSTTHQILGMNSYRKSLNRKDVMRGGPQR